MHTRTLVVDRLITLIVALVLIAAAVAAWLWFVDVLFTADRIDVAPVRDWTATDWWPWVVGAAGLLLILLGLRRLMAHLPAPSVAALRLNRSSDEGSLAVETSALADAATDQLESLEQVRSARGRVLQQRGELVMDLKVVTRPGASLPDVVSACDEVAAAVAQMASRDELTFRVDLRVARRGRPVSRVG